MSKLYQSFKNDQSNGKTSGFDCWSRGRSPSRGEGRLFSGFNLGQTTGSLFTKTPNFVSGPYPLFQGKNRVKFKYSNPFRICNIFNSPQPFWAANGWGPPMSSTTASHDCYRNIPIVQGIEYRRIESTKIWPKSRSSCCDSNLSI
jgi:hypothetical protein